MRDKCITCHLMAFQKRKNFLPIRLPLSQGWCIRWFRFRFYWLLFVVVRAFGLEILYIWCDPLTSPFHPRMHSLVVWSLNWRVKWKLNLLKVCASPYLCPLVCVTRYLLPMHFEPTRFTEPGFTHVKSWRSTRAGLKAISTSLPCRDCQSSSASTSRFLTWKPSQWRTADSSSTRTANGKWPAMVPSSISLVARQTRQLKANDIDQTSFVIQRHCKGQLLLRYPEQPSSNMPHVFLVMLLLEI